MIRSVACDSQGRLTRFLLLLVLCAALPALGNAQAGPPGWLTDPVTRCRIWNPFPQPNETISYSGPCVDGYAHGRGTTRWFSSGQLIETDEGEYKKGKLSGFVVMSFTNGMRFEGNFEENRPHGQGTLRTEYGEVFSGLWSHGCFQDPIRKKSFGVGPEACEASKSAPESHKPPTGTPQGPGVGSN